MRVVNSHSVPTFKSWEVFQQLVPGTQFVLHSESVDVRYAASLSACAGRDAAVWLDCCWFESLPRRVWACWMPSPLVSMKCPRARRSNGSQSLHCRRQKTALLELMIKVRFFFHLCLQMFAAAAVAVPLSSVDLSRVRLDHCGQQLVNSPAISYCRSTPVEWMRNT